MGRTSVRDEGEKKVIPQYTKEQQAAYDRLLPRQRAYIEFRVAGYNRADSYRQAGYKSRASVSQNAYQMERDNPVIKELIDIRLMIKKAKGIDDENSEISREIDALVEINNAKKVLETVRNADAETAAQIQFYRNIVTGKLRTIKRTTFTNSKGQKSVKEEIIEDVETKMKARKELDRLLGISQTAIDVGAITTGDITINIVDASKKDALADKRNEVIIDVEPNVNNVVVTDVDKPESQMEKEFEEINANGRKTRKSQGSK